jgi:hypothetical protein
MNLKIVTHDDQEHQLTVENYDSVELNRQINDNQLLTVEIGGRIFSRITIKEIIPIE